MLQVDDAGWKILDSIDRFLLEFERWEDHGGGDYLDGKTSQALDSLLALKDEPPKGFKGLFSCLDKLSSATDALDAQGSIFSLSDNAEDFFRAVESLRSERNRRYRFEAPPESLRSLYAMQGMAASQLARMFGLVDSRGNPRIDLVERENINPGSVLGPNNTPKDDIDGWEKPLEFPPCRVFLQQREERGETQAMTAEACPETSYDLFLLSLHKDAPLTVKQAAAMLRKTEAEVSAEWEQFRAEQRTQQRLADLRELAALSKAIDPVIQGEPEEEAEEPNDSFDSWTDEELREYAKEQGLVIGPKAKRATILAKIRIAEEMRQHERAA